MKTQMKRRNFIRAVSCGAASLTIPGRGLCAHFKQGFGGQAEVAGGKGLTTDAGIKRLQTVLDLMK
jgi:hypothetical protein